MSTQWISYSSRSGSGGGITTYASAAALPATASDGAAAITLDTDSLYIFNLGALTWELVASPGLTLSVGTVDSLSKVANGAQISSNALILQTADSTHIGLVSTGTQTLAGNKTFSGTIAASNLSGTNTGDVTIGTGNGLSITSQALSLATASASTTGALTSTDWNTFNGKQSALTIGDLTDAGTDGITVTGGTGAVIGSGTSIAQHVADTTNNGYLSSTDWNMFNGKQGALPAELTIAAGQTTDYWGADVLQICADSANQISDGSDAIQFGSTDSAGAHPTTHVLLQSGDNTGAANTAIGDVYVQGGIQRSTDPTALGGNVFISGGFATSGSGGSVSISGGSSAGVNDGPTMSFTGGPAAAGKGGTFGMSAGSSTSGVGGDVSITSGSTTSGSATGAVSIQSWNHTATGNTGAVSLFTGNAAGGNSGTLTLSTGTATGTRGEVSISGRQVNVNSKKIVNLATPTASTDAATKGYVDGIGAVTAVSVASANGFAGSSSGGSTPALTLSTSITGVLKGNGTAISAATAGTDYSAGTSALATGILKSTTSTGALTIAAAGDFPTLNQNTSGTAAGLSSTLVVASGGTGVASTTAYAVLCGGTTTTGPLQSIASVGSSGQVLTSNGASALPTFQAVAAGNLSVTSKSSTYGASSSDNVILVDDSGGSWTLTLPTAVGITGHVYIITRTNSGLTTATTIATTSAQTVGGYASGVVKLTTGNESFQLVSDGSNWIISSHKSNTPWASYTPTFTNLGSTSNVSAYWRRVGDSCQVRMLLTCGTVGATQPQFGLPSAVTIASSKLPSGLGDGAFVGTIGWNGSGVNGTSTVIATAGQTYFRCGVQNATANAVNSAQNGNVWTSSATVALYAEAPIVDWLE